MDTGFLKEKLSERKDSGNLRKLTIKSGLLDFVSNDYLGLARNSSLANQINANHQPALLKHGSTGSRLLSGNHEYYALVESYLKEVFQAEAVLIFNSGYHANQALVSSVAEKGDTIIYDQLSHVCLKEGAWLSKANTLAYRHNDMEDLSMKLSQANGRKFVVTETVFSMDGDFAPIKELTDLCQKHEAYLIVDEAHSTGSYGELGAGFLVDMGLNNSVFARVYTFGKAMGVHGACVAGSQVLIDYLINFARPFIYTTALPPISLISIKESFQYLKAHINLQKDLKQRIDTFREGFTDSISRTAIQPVIMGSNKRSKIASKALFDEGIDVRPILSPTVKKGTERLRISLHVHNTSDQIEKLTSILNRII